MAQRQKPATNKSAPKCQGIVSGWSLLAKILARSHMVDRAGNGQVVVPIEDLILAGAFAALLEQFD
jgi:hypothetical protein